MQNRPSKLGLAVLAFALASALALLSVFVERTGPELEQYGNLCGPRFDEPCYRPLLKGGLPLAYLFDMPGVSVEGQLSFGEDTLRPAAFLVDVGVYFTLILLSILLGSRCRAALVCGANRADA
jgi:hypothetical protein